VLSFNFLCLNCLARSRNILLTPSGSCSILIFVPPPYYTNEVNFIKGGGGGGRIKPYITLFYPAHHITTGEGGAILTNDRKLAQIVRSFRDWGRDCYCDGGKNNSCGHRFAGQYGTLPPGYDHKYVYSEIGYNLKITDMQAAIGCAQMDKLERFCERRKENFRSYTDIFRKYEKYLILPEATDKADPSWFAYIISVKKDAPFSRDEFIQYLNSKLIETRNLFAGNIIRQPFFEGVKYRAVGDLVNSDFIMTNTFFLGTYPGITSEMMDYIKSTVDSFMGKF